MRPAFFIDNGPLSCIRQKCTYRSVGSFNSRLTLPLIAALGGFMLTSGLVLYMHKFIGGWNLLVTGFSLILYVMYTWWRDVIREATFEDQHSIAVQKGLRLGMILFIVSEIMFFFAFF